MPSYPRWTVTCPVAPPASSSTRSSLAASPMKYRPPVSCDTSSTDHTRRDRVHARRQEAPVLQLRFGRLEPRREHHVDLPAVVRRDRPADLVCERGEVQGDVVLRVVVAAREPDAGAAACGPLESLPADFDASERAPVRQEHAIQIPERPVPRRGARGDHERDGDAAAIRAEGVRLRVDHAALVRTESAGNASRPPC